MCAQLECILLTIFGISFSRFRSLQLHRAREVCVQHCDTVSGHRTVPYPESGGTLLVGTVAPQAEVLLGLPQTAGRNAGCTLLE